MWVRPVEHTAAWWDNNLPSNRRALAVIANRPGLAAQPWSSLLPDERDSIVMAAAVIRRFAYELTATATS